MTHDNPYDQREQEARDEDRRQALQDAGEEEMNERRQLGVSEIERAAQNVMSVLGIEDEDGYPADQDEEMTVGLDCCPHLVPYSADCWRCDEEGQDAAYEPGDPKRSDFLDGED